MVSIHHLRTSIDGHEAILLTAMLDSQLVGTTTVRDLFSNPYLASVYVQPEHQRRGVASELIRQALALVQATGIHAVLLVVNDANSGAIACYEALGFRRYMTMEDMSGFSSMAYWFNQNWV